jgi:hypothetical protein
MSFEDWKEMMLRRTGQDPQDLRSRKPNERGADQRTPPDSGHTGLGEEDEIYLNFDTFLHGADGEKEDSSREDDANSKRKEDEDGSAPGYRSKDAGKTCKERFSYSSFDAGATVLKSSPGSKNAKAILAENKDSYMLLECAAESKYVIVELSDDILVDTIVLANFEFFSSMIRHFRVSVSDRYPVKGDKWRELGVFEARNSRDIQPFLVQNPQIWAKYIRIDFLTHFGNEYYCPVSLLRVHGSRMLDTWKEETHQEEEGQHLLEELPQEPNESILPLVMATQELEHPAPETLLNSAGNAHLTSSSPPIFFPSQSTCKAFISPQQSHASSSDGEHIDSQGRDSRGMNAIKENKGHHSAATAASGTDISISSEPPKASSTFTSTGQPPSPDNRVNQPREAINGTTAPGADAGPDSSSSMTRTATAAANSKSRNAGGSAAGAATVQEGFFNAVTKRLQQVETNLTLSLKYVEDQSRYLQETLQRGEQKQLSKVTHFLETLNQTVLADLRHLRDQYDQIWQSTVIALESHRDQSERDILALGSRLNLLADEVVFQKRMAIVQAILLLSCLFLVIFSRGVPIPYFAPVLDQGAGHVPYPTSPSTTLHRPGVFQAHVGITQSTESSHAHEDQLSTYPASGDMRDGSLDAAKILLGHEETSHALSSQELSLFRPLSPSPTPSLEVTDSHVKSTRHNIANSMRQSSTRKPLPALPEHGESL